MNSLFSRLLLTTALLSIFNIALARDGLLDIEMSQTQLTEDVQPTTETGHDRKIEDERGDVLKIETTPPATARPPLKRALLDIKLPPRGANKAQVKRDFGSPLHRESAVGKPPISSWRYEEYTVYFENEQVIHSVLHRKK